MSHARRPNLFIVGAPKCGTTSLHHYLKQHPDVYMSARKEPHFFATDFHAASDRLHGAPKFFQIRTLDQYAELFVDAGQRTIVGEASTSYLYSRQAARNIAAHAPGAKIVICLRDPFSLLRSWHSYLHFCLEEDIPDFRAALAAEPVRKAAQGQAGTMPVSTHHPERLYYRDFIRLGEQVERYLMAFPRSQVHFVMLEELERDPAATYGHLLEFLSLPLTMPDSFEVRNARAIRRSGLLSSLQRDVLDRLSRASKPRALKALVPPAARRWAYAALGRAHATLDKANVVKGSETSYPIDAQLERELRGELASEVQALARLTGRDDLPALWGYDSGSVGQRAATSDAVSTQATQS